MANFYTLEILIGRKPLRNRARTAFFWSRAALMQACTDACTSARTRMHAQSLKSRNSWLHRPARVRVCCERVCVRARARRAPSASAARRSLQSRRDRPRRLRPRTKNKQYRCSIPRTFTGCRYYREGVERRARPAFVFRFAVLAHPFYYLRTFLFPDLRSRKSDPWSLSRPFYPFPNRACASTFIARRRQPFLPSPTRIELRYIITDGFAGWPLLSRLGRILHSRNPYTRRRAKSSL